MALLESKPKLFSSLGLFIGEHKDSALQISELNAPAHGKQILREGRVVSIELHVDPLHQILTVLDVVELELDLDHPEGKEEGQVDLVIWGLVLCCLGHPTE